MRINRPLLALFLCVVGLSTASLLGCFPRPAFTGDGSKWVINDKGEPEKVGSWDHAPDGTIINPKGDTKGAEKVNPKPDAAAGIYETAGYIGKLTALLILASIASLVASYWVPWLPKGAAWKGFAVAGGLIIVRYWLVAYGVVFAQTAFWLTLAVAVAAGLAVGYPWIVGLYNRALIVKGKTLAAKGDAQAGAALVIAGSPDDYKEPGEKTALKTALAVAGVNQ